MSNESFLPLNIFFSYRIYIFSLPLNIHFFLPLNIYIFLPLNIYFFFKELIWGHTWGLSMLYSSSEWREALFGAGGCSSSLSTDGRAGVKGGGCLQRIVKGRGSGLQQHTLQCIVIGSPSISWTILRCRVLMCVFRLGPWKKFLFAWSGYIFMIVSSTMYRPLILRLDSWHVVLLNWKVTPCSWVKATSQYGSKNIHWIYKNDRRNSGRKLRQKETQRRQTES